MAASRALIVVALVAAVFGMASAATYNVGEPNGSWDLRTNYTTWVADKKFHPGDQIVFKYSPQAHDVVEVDKAAYDSCSTGNATPLTTGNDVISLTQTGTRYFICGFPSHCSSGMKVQIDVVDTASSGGMPPAGAPGAPAGAPGAPGTSPSPPSGSTPGNSAATMTKAAGFGLAAAVVLAATGLIA